MPLGDPVCNGWCTDMCGLAGVFNFATGAPVDAATLLALREAMVSRGPDGAGLWIDAEAGVGLAHRRLAIVDLTDRGAQPMASADSRYRVVFNGEIYNYPELRRWCEHKGARFASDCDTEVLLQLYAIEGAAMLKRLRGMFAFALWDAPARSLLLARDPFGIKPLYYAQDGQGLRFASQVKALLAGGVATHPDPAGIASFYLWGYVTDPHTCYRAIRALPAGCMLKCRPGHTPVIEQYCDPLEPLRDPHPEAESDFASLRDAVLDSVRHHRLADVPVGLFLSAGIDSASLCALNTECQRATGITAVTLGFAEYRATPNDEVPLARAIASRYGVRHRVVEYTADDFVQERARLFAAMDQPTVDGVNTYFVSKATAASSLKVAMSGVGGDELFGGYPSFRQIPRLVRYLHYVPRRAGKTLRHVLAPLVSRLTSPKYAGALEYGGDVAGAYLLRRALFMPWEIPALMDPEMAAAGLGELDVLHQLDRITRGIESPWDQVMALEHAVYLGNCLLRDADWAGMAHSLEIRTPLVDATLFAQTIAMRATRRAGRPFTKHDWARTPAVALPSNLFHRPKTGFSVPVREWVTQLPDIGTHGRRSRGWAGVVFRSVYRELA